MRLRSIEALHALFRTGAISRAARLLGISQPAASKLVRHAEQQLGFALFERVKGRLVPTREAEILAPEIERLFRQLEHVQRLGQNLGPERQGRIRLGCIPSLALSIVPSAIHALQQVHPQVRYEVLTQHTNELVEGILAQDIDIALAYDHAPSAGIRIEKLCRGQMVFIQPASGADEVRLEDLPRFPMIGLASEDPLGRLLRQRLNAEGISLAPQIEVQTYYLACALVAKGCGASVVDMFTALSLMTSNIAVAQLRPAIHFDVVALSNELRPLPRHCVDFIAEVRRQCRAALAQAGQPGARVNRSGSAGGPHA